MENINGSKRSDVLTRLTRAAAVVATMLASGCGESTPTPPAPITQSSAEALSIDERCNQNINGIRGQLGVSTDPSTGIIAVHNPCEGIEDPRDWKRVDTDGQAIVLQTCDKGPSVSQREEGTSCTNLNLDPLLAQGRAEIQPRSGHMPVEVTLFRPSAQSPSVAGAHEKVRGQFDDLNGALGDFQAELQTKKDELAATQGELAASQAEIAAKELQIDELTTKITSITAERDALIEEAKRLQRVGRNSKAEIDALVNRILQKDTQLEEMEQKFNDTRKELMRLKGAPPERE